MMRTRSSKDVVASQPSFSRAFEASPQSALKDEERRTAPWTL